MNTVSITVQGQAPMIVAKGTLVSQVLPPVCSNEQRVLGAIVNNMVVSLTTPLYVDATVEPLTFSDSYGWSVYRNTLCFLLAKACHELNPAIDCRVRNSLGSGFYCTLEEPDGDKPDTPEMIAALKKAMDELIRQDLPITMESISYESAVNLFKKTGQRDKLNLLEHRNPPLVVLSQCGGFSEISQHPLLPRLGLIHKFDLTPFEDGFLLRVPESARPDTLPQLPSAMEIFQVYRKHIAWGRAIGISTVGDLNRAIASHRAEDFVRTVEALHDKRLGEIADQIAARPKVKLVLVAGPSSAGKTTFAMRLCTHLRVNGLKPLLISTDNYFVGDARNPRDKEGNLDYEHLDAVDRPRLNSDMRRLMQGEAVRMRSFDFAKHDGFDQPFETRMDDNGIIVMEGIHSLNPDLTPDILPEEKFLIYINTLTQLGVDCSNRISTTDNRLVRRLVRDFHFRKRDPVDTLRMWQSVGRGERRWIYPFQHLADAVFNSALDYELAVLKPTATILLNQIKPWHREYLVARRLSGMLHNFSTLAADVVPGDSILRETIGGSQLNY